MRLLREATSPQVGDAHVPRRPLRLLVYASVLKNRRRAVEKLLAVGCGLLVVADEPLEPGDLPSLLAPEQVTLINLWLSPFWGNMPTVPLSSFREEGFATGTLIALTPQLPVQESMNAALLAARESGAQFVVLAPLSLTGEDKHLAYEAAFGEDGNDVFEDLLFHSDPVDVAKTLEVHGSSMAYELGCKGITIYRDRSRESQVLNVGGPVARAEAPAGARPSVPPGEAQAPPKGDEHAPSKVNGAWGSIRPIPRPRRLSGFSDRKETPMGNLYLTLNVMNGHPFELFAQIGKAGSDVTAFTEAIARLISLAFRCGVAPEEVARQLVGIGGSRSVGYGKSRVRSVPDAIGRFILEFIQPEEGAGDGERGGGTPAEPGLAPDPVEAENPSLYPKNLCPSCGLDALVHAEGCAKCPVCGYSEC